MVENRAEMDTFATYLAKVLTGRRGFVASLPVALVPLRAACDRVVVRADGLILQVACIVDRDARAGATFAMEAADVLTLELA